MTGRLVQSGKLRIGYFAQHQVDELVVEDTPLDHLRRERPEEDPKKWRGRLSGFGLMAEQVDIPVGQLSGGQKARLSLLLATLDAPHLLILDEPTNHLDIESREALVEALTDYTGAVILVTHDMHLLELVADRLWLVSDGTVRPYDGDLVSYRDHLLNREASATKTAKKLKTPKSNMQSLRADLRKAEERIEKLNVMHAKLSEKLADPDIYSDVRKQDLEVWQGKFAEVKEAMLRAEELWLNAQDALDKAESPTG